MVFKNVNGKESARVHRAETFKIVETSDSGNLPISGPICVVNGWNATLMISIHGFCR